MYVYVRRINSAKGFLPSLQTSKFSGIIPSETKLTMPTLFEISGVLGGLSRTHRYAVSLVFT